MKKNLKRLIVLAMAGCLSVSSAMVSFADWEKDEYNEDVYRKEDGNLAQNEWVQVGDKWYYFDGSSPTLVSITRDGYTLAEDGSWDQSIPQKTHEQIRTMYLASVEVDVRIDYEMWLDGSYFNASSEEEVIAYSLSYANFWIEYYPTLSPDEVVTSQEFDQMIEKIRAEDANERGKNMIKCILLSGNNSLSDLDFLVNANLENAGPEYKEQVKSEIRAEYEQLLQ